MIGGLYIKVKTSRLLENSCKTLLNAGSMILIILKPELISDRINLMVRRRVCSLKNGIALFGKEVKF